MSQDELKEKFRNELQLETDSILELKRDYLEVRSISDELDRYKEEDDKIWMRQVGLFKIARNSYQKTVIDLASYCTAWIKEKGFLWNMDSYCSLFHVKTADEIPEIPLLIYNLPDEAVQISPEETNRVTKEVQESRRVAEVERLKSSFQELFPGWDENKGVTLENTKALRSAFRREIVLLDQIRNDHLAHRFEKKNLERRAITPSAEFHIVDRVFMEIEEILKYAWHIIFDISYVFPRYQLSSPEHHIRDFVDLLRLGSIHEVLEATGIATVLEKTDRKWYWRFRQDDNGKDRYLPLSKRNRGNV